MPYESPFNCAGNRQPPHRMEEPPWAAKARKRNIDYFKKRGEPVPEKYVNFDTYGVCPVCGKVVGTLKDGTMRPHVNSGRTLTEMEDMRARRSGRQAKANSVAIAGLKKMLEEME
jgi:hypothetical protein